MEGLHLDRGGKIAIFDFDGTLVETTAANNYAYMMAIRDVIGKRIDVPMERLTHHNIVRLYDLGSDEAYRVVKTKNDYYADGLSLTRVLPCMNVLMALRNIGYQIILLTNGKRSRVEQVITYHDMGTLFDRMFFYDDYEGFDKYEWLLRNSNINVSDILCFENEKDEVTIANSIGISYENIFITNFIL